MRTLKITRLLLYASMLGIGCSFNVEAAPGQAVKIQPSIPEEAQDYDLTFSVLDVGQGLSLLVESNGEYLLYDGGDRYASSYVVSYLKNEGIDQLDYVVASHYDSDHINGVIGALNAFPVDTIIGPDYIHDSQTYQSFTNTVASLGKEVEHPVVGTTYELGSADITVLAPAEIVDDSNDNSVALKIENGENSFIVTGDAEYTSEAKMLASGIDIDTDVLVIGHHGSASSTSWDFIEATTPEYAIISCGEGNSYGHPDADTMEKLESMEISVFRTDKQGNIIATSDGTDITWNVEPCNDYSSGDGSLGTLPAGALSAESVNTESSTSALTSANNTQPKEQIVWLSATGSKYHSKPDCGTMNPDTARQISIDDAISQGYEPCKKCY